MRLITIKKCLALPSPSFYVTLAQNKQKVMLEMNGIEGIVAQKSYVYKEDRI